MSWKVLQGDSLDVLRTLPDESVQCCVTSPPYWGLRDYGVAGQLGLERTPEEYVAKMVEGFREVRRVLRKDGTLWLNLGDSYAGAPVGSFNGGGFKDKSAETGGRDLTGVATSGRMNKLLGSGLKPKDLCGIPWMVAFALRADGWYLRSEIIWSKRNPMPESVTDRPTKAHEQIFLLAKSERYFYDAEAIKEEVSGTAHARGDGVNPKAKATGRNSRQCVDRDPAHLQATRTKQNESFSGAVNELVSSRNKRSVWEIATAPFPEAHFATFPPKLVEPCILAGTSERGCCAICGAPWKRVTEPSERYAKALGSGFHDHSDDDGKGMMQCRGENRQNIARDVYGVHSAEYITTGWIPSCECKTNLPPVPCTVIDPFNGAGTTGVVARRLQRNYIGIELNPDYVEMAKRRIEQDQPLFNSVEVE